MNAERVAKSGKCQSQKRMLAAGRKVDGVWQVKTFLRAATTGTREIFWEAPSRRAPK